MHDVRQAVTAPTLEAARRAPFTAAGDTRGRLACLIEEAAQQITRLTATQAFVASQQDAVILDIRSQDSRALHGVIPASLHIPRTVLEWRVALESPWRNPYLCGEDQHLILCDHGYSSILAASNLVQLGFSHTGDVIGGFESWKDTGLPILTRWPQHTSINALPGSGPPD